MRLAALALVAAFALAPRVAEARRVRLKSTRDATATLARWRARAALPARNPRCAECTRHGLSIARALFKQKGLGNRAKGIFAGRDPVTNERKVVHLELISEVGDTFTIKTEHIAGDLDGIATTRVFRPGSSPGQLVSTDGTARVLLIRGRGFFDYHDTSFVGDPE
jgi:hypothetical protein